MRADRLRQRRGAAGGADRGRRGALRDARRARRAAGGRAAAGPARAAGRGPGAADRAQPRARGERETRWTRVKARPVRDEDGSGAARDQRDRGHHRAQARRAGPALPGRGGPRALRARSTTRRRWPPWRGWRCPTSPTGAPSRCSPTACCTASRSSTWSPRRSQMALGARRAATRPTEGSGGRPRGAAHAARLRGLSARSPTRCWSPAPATRSTCALLRSLGMTSVMLVPMRVRGTCRRRASRS